MPWWLATRAETSRRLIPDRDVPGNDASVVFLILASTAMQTVELHSTLVPNRSFVCRGTRRKWWSSTRAGSDLKGARLVPPKLVAEPVSAAMPRPSHTAGPSGSGSTTTLNRIRTQQHP